MNKKKDILPAAAGNRPPCAREMAYYDALKRITMYDPPERLRKRAERDYGLSGNEAVDMAYENVLNEARMAIKGRKRPRSLAQGTLASVPPQAETDVCGAPQGEGE